MRNIGFPGVSLCLVEANFSRPTQRLNIGGLEEPVSGDPTARKLNSPWLSVSQKAVILPGLRNFSRAHKFKIYGSLCNDFLGQPNPWVNQRKTQGIL